MSGGAHRPVELVPARRARGDVRQDAAPRPSPSPRAMGGRGRSWVGEGHGPLEFPRACWRDGGQEAAGNGGARRTLWHNARHARCRWTAVLGGAVLAGRLPMHYLRWSAAALFWLFGLLAFVSALRGA